MTGRALAAGAGLAVLFAVTVLQSEKAVSRQAQPDRVTVVYWEKWSGTEKGSEAEAMRKVVNDFNRSQNRIFVKYLSVSGVDTKTLLATAGGNPPDVAGIWADQVCQFADAKALTDLTDMAQSAGLGPDYYIPAYRDALTYHDRLWALPSTPASIALHVRTDLVPADVATPETFPKTIGGLDALVKRISKKKPNGDLDLAGFMPSSPGWWHWAWAAYFGGKLVDGDRLTVDCPENLRAFEWIASYAKLFGSKEVQTFQSGFGNFASPNDPFMSGKTAMELNGVWKANYIHLYKPDLKWFAVPFPYPDDRPELAGHANLSQDVLAIPRGAKHLKEAFEFIQYVQRQDVMEGLCTSHGKNSPLNKVSESFFQHHPNPFIRLFDQLARSPKAINPPKIGIYKQINDELNVAFQEVNTGQKTPKQALTDAQNRLVGQWETYKAQVLNR